jgi:hypothetical protein
VSGNGANERCFLHVPQRLPQHPLIRPFMTGINERLLVQGRIIAMGRFQKGSFAFRATQLKATYPIGEAAMFVKNAVNRAAVA